MSRSPRALVTGGAGFVGSHLCGRLLLEGWEVVCMDNLLTGSEANLRPLLDRPGFRFERSDVTERVRVDGPLDAVLHLASCASPLDYMRHPLETLKSGSLGTLETLEVALAKDATFLLASTSEVYGDPTVHPQPESYWGNVNPVGPRSVYDESKRFAEALAMAYHRARDADVRIVRIFNTYGPGMRRHDGRAVPTFVDQALREKPLTVHGTGTQTRSLCYVDDTVDGLWRLLGSDHVGPVNVGNPHEVTVLEIAEAVIRITSSRSEIRFVPRPQDDPEVRCPDISLARRVLGWDPRIGLEEGLDRTISWARAAWGRTGERPA